MKLSSLLFFLAGILLISMRFPYSGKMVAESVKSGITEVSPALFIAESFFQQYDLQHKPTGNQYLKTWTNNTKGCKYAIVNDIRIVFDNKSKAKAFFKKNFKDNSEHIPEIASGISISGIEDLHVFKESDVTAKFNRSLGYIPSNYIYLFLINNVYVKVFVSAIPEISVNDAVVFAREAAKTVHTVAGS